MALVNITTNKYLILINGELIKYVHNTSGNTTTYCDSCWAVEEYSTEQEWIDRLDQLGITIE